jgi:hypothetical protein
MSAAEELAVDDEWDAGILLRERERERERARTRLAMEPKKRWLAEGESAAFEAKVEVGWGPEEREVGEGAGRRMK